MKIKIFCPNCQHRVGEDIFSQVEELREYCCEKCNTVFDMSLIDEGEQSDNNTVKGSFFDLTLNNEENFPWRKFNDNLSPNLSCVLCTGELGGNKIDTDQSKKCRECGAILHINFS